MLVVDRAARGSHQADDLLPLPSLPVHQVMIAGHLASGRAGVALHVHDEHGVAGQLVQGRGDTSLPAAGDDSSQAAVNLHASGQGRDRRLELRVERGDLPESFSLGCDQLLAGNDGAAQLREN
jgi:hypothetical protein